MDVMTAPLATEGGYLLGSASFCQARHQVVRTGMGVDRRGVWRTGSRAQGRGEGHQAGSLSTSTGNIEWDSTHH